MELSEIVEFHFGGERQIGSKLPRDESIARRYEQYQMRLPLDPEIEALHTQQEEALIDQDQETVDQISRTLDEVVGPDYKDPTKVN